MNIKKIFKIIVVIFGIMCIFGVFLTSGTVSTGLLVLSVLFALFAHFIEVEHDKQQNNFNQTIPQPQQRFVPPKVKFQFERIPNEQPQRPQQYSYGPPPKNYANIPPPEQQMEEELDVPPQPPQMQQMPQMQPTKAFPQPVMCKCGKSFRNLNEYGRHYKLSHITDIPMPGQ